VKKPQWITLTASLILVVILYLFGRIVPEKKENIGRQSDVADNSVSIDSILSDAKKRLDPAQIVRLSALENSVVRGSVNEQRLRYTTN